MEATNKSTLEIFKEKMRELRSGKTPSGIEPIKLPDNKAAMERFKARIAKHSAAHPVTKEQMAQIMERIKNNKKE